MDILSVSETLHTETPESYTSCSSLIRPSVVNVSSVTSPASTTRSSVAEPLVSSVFSMNRCPDAVSDVPEKGTDRRAVVDSEDSSYDSDQDCGSEASGTESRGSRYTGDIHRQVERSVSDTLCAEFSEYVTTEAPPNGGRLNYGERVRFACKLGFTEEHVRRALKAIEAAGGVASQNEFVRQLVASGHELDSPVDSEHVCGEDRDCPTATANGDSGGALARNQNGDGLRYIVIDGSNVAMSHGNREVFSCRGIQMAVEYFRSRGHSAITVFVPMWRKEAPRADTPITDQHLLLQLEKERVLVFTPSRVVDGKRINCYDDRYILQTAVDHEGVVVSNDNYRDLYRDNPLFRQVVEQRLLMYSFVNDRFMPPDDPLGRNGPKLDAFLRHIQPNVGNQCPYGKKCTYGNKCKYYHPERGSQPMKMVSERLQDHAHRSQQPQHLGSRRAASHKTLSLPVTSASSSPAAGGAQIHKRKVTRTRSLATAAVSGGRTSPTSPAETVTTALNCVSRKWSDPMLSSSAGPSNSLSLQQQHIPLARQLTLNPIHDERIAHHQQRRHSQHASVSRNLSAPGFSGGAALAHAMSVPPPPLLASQPIGAAAACVDMRQSPSGSIWSHPPPGFATPPHRLFSPTGAVGGGSFIPGGATSRHQELRDRVYWHLVALFDEESVRQAMACLPEEACSDPSVVCALILQQQQRQCC